MTIGRLLAFLLFLSIFQSCKTREKLVYFQQGSIDSVTNVQSGFTPVLHVDDLLSIMVTSLEPEAAKPFNLISLNPSAGGVSTYSNGNPALNGYLIDKNGDIQFPILGDIHLADLDRAQATEIIRNKLSSYLPDAVVQIQILNYKITVLGDVKIPGTYRIPNERISILEAIGLAGDLNMTGNRKNILVIREQNGAKKEIRLDLTKNEIFSSPAYYLQQNDVVYVEPNAAARTNSTLWRATGGIFISLTSLIITTIVLVTRK